MKLLILSLMSVLFFAGQGWAGPSAGWIDSFVGRAADYELLRNGMVVPVAIYTQLENGDELSVFSEGLKMKISLADGTSITVEKNNTPYKIDSDAVTPSIVSNMLSWAGNTLNIWNNEASDGNPTMEMRSRNPDLFNKPPLKAPLFDSKEMFVLEGLRPLYIAWRGGRGPYRVRLIETGSGIVKFEVNEIGGERLKTGLIELVAGKSYQVEISDIGETFKFIFNAKKDEDIPNAVDEMSNSKLHLLAMRMLYATWLVGIHEEWAFEAYQIASEIENMYMPGHLLRVALEQGKRPE
jgi:hypothetical protein